MELGDVTIVFVIGDVGGADDNDDDNDNGGSCCNPDGRQVNSGALRFLLGFFLTLLLVASPDADDGTVVDDPCVIEGGSITNGIFLD